MIRHDNSDQVVYRTWRQPYPGTLEDIQSEVIPRISALFARAPMREDFANAGIFISPEIQEKALLELADYLYHFKLTDRSGLKWSQKVREVFERIVWPELNALEAEKRDHGSKFLKMVNRAFDHMEDQGRGLKTHEVRKAQRAKLGV